MFGRCLIVSGEMGCSEEMLAVVAMVSCDAVVFNNPRDQREEAAEAHRRFASRSGDHGTLLAVFNGWCSAPKKEQLRWCTQNFLNSRALRKAHDILEQLKRHLGDLNIPLRSCGEDEVPLRRALVAGLFPHAARQQRNGKCGHMKRLNNSFLLSLSLYHVPPTVTLPSTA
jgi:ATP-dependent RNA helicase DHX8/PRP22